MTPSSWDPYLDLDSGVLRNRLGITDPAALALAARDHLRGLDRAEFLNALTELCAALLYLHPVREGNGRSIRSFLAQLADQAGYHLHWSDLDGEANRSASHAAHHNDLKPLHTMLDLLLTPQHPPR